MSKLDRTPCPKCEGLNVLAIDLRMKVKELGEFSLAGEQLKVAGRFVPCLYCTKPDCDFETYGWLEDNHAVFPGL